MLVIKYLRELTVIAAKPSWNNVNGLGGALISLLAAIFWPISLFSEPAWANPTASFFIYAGASYLVLLLFQILFVAPYQLWVRDRRVVEAGGLEIVFDPGDQRFVRDKIGLYDNVATRRWWVGIRNRSKTTSIDAVSLRAQEGHFVRYSIAIAYDPNTPKRVPIVLERKTLPPGATEYVELFGLDGNVAKGSSDDLFAKPQRFTLEARGRDTPTVEVEFEYLPTIPPTIRRVN